MFSIKIILHVVLVLFRPGFVVTGTSHSRFHFFLAKSWSAYFLKMIDAIFPKAPKRIGTDALDKVLSNEEMEYQQTIEAIQSNLSLRGILREMMILSNKKGVN